MRYLSIFLLSGYIHVSCADINSIPSSAVIRFRKTFQMSQFLAAGCTLGYISTSCSNKASAAEQPLTESDDPLLDSDRYKKQLFNIPPKVVQYPDYFEGTWRTNLTFKDAKFSSAIPFKALAMDVNIAGFRQYSVASIADVGSSASDIFLQYKRSKAGAVIEDRLSNTLSLFAAFAGRQFNSKVSGVQYDPDSNPNRFSLDYRAPSSVGHIDLFSNSRNIAYEDSAVAVTECMRQSTVRQKNGQRPSQTICDYATEWILRPSSGQQTEVLPDQLSGTYRIVSYLQPQDDLYFQRPLLPIGIFTYTVSLDRVK